MEEKLNESKAQKNFIKILKVILGIIFLAFGLTAVIKWLPDFLVIVKGLSGIFLMLSGLIFLAIAKD